MIGEGNLGPLKMGFPISQLATSLPSPLVVRPLILSYRHALYVRFNTVWTDSKASLSVGNWECLSSL